MMRINKLSLAFFILARISSGFVVTPSTTRTLTAIGLSSMAEPPTLEGNDNIEANNLVSPNEVNTLEMEKPKKKPLPKKVGNNHKEGLFSPLVKFVKFLLGDKKLNKIRGDVISMHSDIIKSFVATSDTEFGQFVLRRLFELSDKDHNGKIDKDELEKSLSALGFDWLKEKQVSGILKRADANDNGVIDFDEFMVEAPKTLKTNLVKLAKKNGGELGFLV